MNPNDLTAGMLFEEFGDRPHDGAGTVHVNCLNGQQRPLLEDGQGVG